MGEERSISLYLGEREIIGVIAGFFPLKRARCRVQTIEHCKAKRREVAAIFLVQRTALQQKSLLACCLKTWFFSTVMNVSFLL